MNCRFFTQVEPITDTYQHLRRHLFGLLFIRMIVFTLLLGVTTLLESRGQPVIQPPPTMVLAFLSLIYIFSLGSTALLQAKKRHLPRFGLIQLLADTLFIALLVYGTGASRSLFTPMFILPVIYGGLLLYRMGGLVPAAFSTLLYGLLLYAEHLGYIPAYFAATSYEPPKPLTANNLFAFYGLLFFLAALISGSLAGRLRSTEVALSRTVLDFDRLSLLYKQIFDDIATGIITIDDSGCISSLNHAAERITALQAETVVGSNYRNFFPMFQLTDHGRHVVDYTKANGDQIRIGYSCANLNLPAGQTAEEPGCTDCKLITLQDISKLEQMERQVREAEKMAAIGKMSASIAHDFRNPLASISGSAQILAMDFPQDQQASTQHSLVEIILRESERMARLINEFLQFARPAQPVRTLCNLQTLVQDAIAKVTVKNGRYADCRITPSIDAHMQCLADGKQLACLLEHLLENSCAASAQCLEPVTVTATMAADGDSVTIRVTDQGEGIAPELQEKIFEPFFTTRVDGSGLGLTIVRLICELHQGTLQLESAPGQGCRVSLNLPMTDNHSQEKEAVKM